MKNLVFVRIKYVDNYNRVGEICEEVEKEEVDDLINNCELENEILDIDIENID